MYSARSTALVAFAVFGLALTAGSAQAAMVIRNMPTHNVSCSAGVCTATASSAVMNITDLTGMLASSDVTLISGSMAKDMKVLSAFSWTSAHRLTLDAYRSTAVERPVTLAGSGALTLTTNDGGTGGTLSFSVPGRVAFWDLSSSLVINGASYPLVGDIATLASAIASNPSGRYALADNYDASVDGIYASAPIPTTFAGKFNGLGNLISKLTIHGQGKMNLGLFAEIGTGGVVENIGLGNVTVRGRQRSPIGALAAENYGSIINAFAKGFVGGGGSSIVGGLVGNNFGSIVSSYTTGKVIGDFAGGLVGGSASNNGVPPRISRSHSTADVSFAVNGQGVVGGLVGEWTGSLTDSWAGGTATIGDDNGQNSPRASAGGLVGSFVTFASSNVDFKDCYATGTVTGGQNANVGGLVGSIIIFDGPGPPISDSYSAGQVTGGPGSYIGGLVGDTIRTAFADMYWDTDTSGITDLSEGDGNVPNAPGITGLTTAQFQSGLPAGFAPAIWAENPSINGGLPYLIANPPP